MGSAGKRVRRSSLRSGPLELRAPDSKQIHLGPRQLLATYNFRSEPEPVSSRASSERRISQLDHFVRCKSMEDIRPVGRGPLAAMRSRKTCTISAGWCNAASAINSRPCVLGPCRVGARRGRMCWW